MDTDTITLVFCVSMLGGFFGGLLWLERKQLRERTKLIKELLR